MQYGKFTFFQSLQILSLVLIGGVGFVIGPLIGAAATTAGVLSWLTSDVGILER